MKKFNIFYFESFSFDRKTLVADFLYSFDREEFFTEQIDFSSELELRWNIDDSVIQSLLFHCHIALWISYYKLFPAKQLKVLSGDLDAGQINFWKKFYINGLWEFLIKNNIKPDWLFQFESDSCVHYSLISPFEDKGSTWNGVEGEGFWRALLPWGWWKDSIVSALLLEDKLDFTPYVFWKIDSIKSETLAVLWKDALLTRRTLSPNLFSLNDKWYYNGHVPITGIIAFISIVSAYLYNYKYIVLSNEWSANEANTTWEWIEINHQYSKSLEFEQDFDNYLCEYVTEDIKYFSLLRWFSEYKIAEIFSQQAQKYFLAFASCNKNFVITGEKKHRWSWCDRCEKCAFVFLILRNILRKFIWSSSSRIYFCWFDMIQ